MKTGHRRIKLGKITWFALALLTTILIVWLELLGDQISEKAGNTFSGNILAFLGYGLLSLSLSHFLSKGKFKHPFPYRIAFFVSLFMGLLVLLLESVIDNEPLIWENVPFIIIGSFLGSFVASNDDLRWWENNSPPSSQLEAQVLEKHTPFLGSTVRRSFAKRLFDIFFAAIALVLSLPVWLSVIVLIWWEDPGPILFVKNSVGRGGRNFKQFKFRSMILNAEKETGPISGYENDERVLFFGKFLRKTALDELPQLINILIGDMSMVGPRPQRTVLVNEYLKKMPAYARRHQVRPGLAGLAQVVDAYDISAEEKLAWDLIYIQKANLWLDIKLIFSAFYLVFFLRWLHDPHPEERIRKLLNIEKSEKTIPNDQASQEPDA
ncbi:MAG: sugar transferase [Brevefilum sp.]